MAVLDKAYGAAQNRQTHAESGQQAALRGLRGPEEMVANTHVSQCPRLV